MSGHAQLDTVCPNNHNLTVGFTRDKFEAALKTGGLILHCNTCEANWPPSMTVAPEKGAIMAGRKEPAGGYGMDFSRAAQSGRRLGHSDQLPYGNSSCPTATARFAITDGATVVRSAITRSSFPKCSLQSREIFTT